MSFAFKFSILMKGSAEEVDALSVFCTDEFQLMPLRWGSGLSEAEPSSMHQGCERERRRTEVKTSISLWVVGVISLPLLMVALRHMWLARAIRAALRSGINPYYEPHGGFADDCRAGSG
jgi:hypothetical protein